jgi:SecD/SecF fusion protein
MNQNNLWKLGIVVLVLLWSIFQISPPVGKKLGDVFQERAIGKFKDAEYTNIVERFKKLQQQFPNRTDYANLTEAIGTSDFAKYFPDLVDAKEELNPNNTVLSRLQREASGKIKLGIDLQGGTSFLVSADYSQIETNAAALAAGTNSATTGTNAASRTNAVAGGISDDQKRVMLNEAVEVLRKRVDALGVSEPVIQPEGEDRILIQMPGLSEDVKGQARTNIQRVAYLEFRLVHPDSDSLVAQGLTEPGYQLMKMKSEDSKSGGKILAMMVKKKPELTGNAIRFARVGHDAVGQAQIEFTLTSEGADIFSKVTGENIGHLLAIVLDGRLISAPVIKGEIGANGVIEGHFKDEEAQSLASALNNPLQVPVKIQSESSVDPTLGKDTVASGVRSAIIGTLLVAGFMACYYLLAGVVADLALITNIIILLGVMCSIGTTLTLPGIAGVVLTIGMAVDANVLIFERIREESEKGKSLRGALAAGYSRAFGTIFDSHVTTLISSIILIFMGTGPIKGFGVTLTIGVAASLFTALVVTRLIFDFMISQGWVKQLKMFHFFGVTKIDFMKVATPAFIATWTLIIVGLGYGVAVRGHNMMGIDFAGGDSKTFSFSQKVTQKDIGAVLAKIPEVKDPVIQYQRDVGGGTEVLRVTSPIGTGDKVADAITKDFAAQKYIVTGTEHVGATIGKEIQMIAIGASALSLLGILFYVAVRYEFYFAVGAVVAVFHDVLLTIGCYCLTGLFGEGRQFNATMVAAVLTIIGFSINDTIVIFDRIREDLKIGVRGSFKEIINKALNQTLSRTIITSGTVFLATVSLYVFGGGAINDFAYTFLVGIITGTYSSIYIASYLVLKLHKGQRPKLGSQVAMTANSTAEASTARA